jgi:RNA 3'-terminal phosphate cyclase (ATP)
MVEEGTMLEIDGSIGEGGGQVLRSALALSALTLRPMRIYNIRENRPSPGLAPQHLTAARALAEISAALMEGDALGSTEIVFRPRRIPVPGAYSCDVGGGAKGGSAGSVTLILQALLLPLSLASEPSEVRIKGGTHVAWSPSYDYLEDVFLHALSRIGVQANCELEAWGFYPRGGGEIHARVEGRGDRSSVVGAGPTEPAGRPQGDGGKPAFELGLKGLQIPERGILKKVWGRAVACNLPSHIPQRMADRARSLLSPLGVKAQIEPRRVRGVGPGAGIFLTAEFDHVRAGFSALGERGKPSEEVAEEAVERFRRYLARPGAVDPHLGDQLLLPLALASGPSHYSVSEITGHLLTNRDVILMACGREIEVDGNLGEPGQVTVRGPNGG